MDALGIDYSDLFTTHKWFECKDALLDWVREVANENRVVVVVKRSDGGGVKGRHVCPLVVSKEGTIMSGRVRKNRIGLTQVLFVRRCLIGIRSVEKQIVHFY